MRVRFWKSKKVDDKITITITCPMCGKDHEVTLTEQEFADVFYSNKPIQDALPNAGKFTREKLMSGYCDDCQKLLFGGR